MESPSDEEWAEIKGYLAEMLADFVSTRRMDDEALDYYGLTSFEIARKVALEIMAWIETQR